MSFLDGKSLVPAGRLPAGARPDKTGIHDFFTSMAPIARHKVAIVTRAGALRQSIRPQPIAHFLNRRTVIEWRHDVTPTIVNKTLKLFTGGTTMATSLTMIIMMPVVLGLLATIAYDDMRP